MEKHVCLSHIICRCNIRTSSPIDNITFSRKHGIRGFACSIIPGWGQFYKGQKVKGTCIMGEGEILFIGGIIATESLRSSYVKRETNSLNSFRPTIPKPITMKIPEIYALVQPLHCMYNCFTGSKAYNRKKQEFPLIQPTANSGFSGIFLSWKFLKHNAYELFQE